MIEDDDFPSEAQQVAALISGSGSSKAIAVTKQISYRAPIFHLAHVDALAAQAGKSRAAMLTLLLGVGLEEVRKQLPKKVLREVESKAAELMVEFGNGDEVTEE